MNDDTAESQRDSYRAAWTRAENERYAAEAEVARLTKERDETSRMLGLASVHARQYEQQRDAAEAEVARLTKERDETREVAADNFAEAVAAREVCAAAEAWKQTAANLQTRADEFAFLRELLVAVVKTGTKDPLLDARLSEELRSHE